MSRRPLIGGKGARGQGLAFEMLAYDGAWGYLTRDNVACIGYGVGIEQYRWQLASRHDISMPQGCFIYTTIRRGSSQIPRSR